MRFGMLAAVVGLGMLMAGPASAQLGGIDKPVSLTVRAGGFWPNDDDLGSTWLALGVDARINIQALPIIGGQTVSLDYLSKGSDANMLAITLSQRFGTPSLVPGQPRPYFGMGFGYYRLHGDNGIESETESGPGLKLFAGVDIGQNMLIQADYHVPSTSRVAGVRGRGFTVTAGLKF